MVTLCQKYQILVLRLQPALGAAPNTLLIRHQDLMPQPTDKER